MNKHSYHRGGGNEDDYDALRRVQSTTINDLERDVTLERQMVEGGELRYGPRVGSLNKKKGDGPKRRKKSVESRIAPRR